MNRSFLRPGISFVLAAVLLLSATACAAHEPVLPPSRWGEMQIRSMFERYYSISDAFQAADAVARVTVGDWQGEDLHNWVTFFDADVQESYKGDLPRHFTLVQGGCSEASSPNYPLFINGTELLVFLRIMTAARKNITPSPITIRYCMPCMMKTATGIFWIASGP